MVCPGSFVDSKLAWRHTDMLFSAKLDDLDGQDVYALIEHQSTPDRMMRCAC